MQPSRLATNRRQYSAQQGFPWRYFATLLALLIGISAAIDTLASRVLASPLHSEDNLIENPGFEAGSGDTVDVWGFYGDVTWTDEEVYSGNRAMRVAAQNSSSSIQSAWFQVPSHARMAVGAWLKAEDIVSGDAYFMLRVTLNAFAADQETRLYHWDLVTLEGTFDWTHFQSSIIVPPDVAYFRLSIQLTESSGTFWVDDVTAHVVQTLPPVEDIAIGAPVVLPQPWQMRTTGALLPLSQVRRVGLENDPRLGEHLALLLQQMELESGLVPPTELPSGERAGNATVAPEEIGAEGDTILWIGDRADAHLNQQFGARFPHIAWDDLGEQGYFLATTFQQQRTLIYLGGNTEAARFHGFQTLRQLIDPAQRTVAVAEIADRPSLARRGAPIGVQWFREQNELFDRMARLKMNFVWIQGSFLNEKFWFRWREPLTSQEMAEIEDYIAAAHRHFIVPHIAIAPRGADASAPTLYSSDAEIDLVVHKMLGLYNRGLRHFGLAFDDLDNFGQDVLFGDDVNLFNNNIGAAHAYFTTQVYNRLRVVYPDIQFMVVPMRYEAISHLNEVERDYLRALAQLPAEIGIYSAIEDPVGAAIMLELTNRRHMVWDNFWSSFYQGAAAPETVIPLQRSPEFGPALITGYSFAPLIPLLQDDYRITWRTAADYAWAPERYNAYVSFQLAAAQHLNRGLQGDPALTTPPPRIFPDSGIYTPPLSVILSFDQEPAPEMAIRYTLDGTLPTLDAQLYTEPFSVLDGANVRVRARIFQNGTAVSDHTNAFFQVATHGTPPPVIDPDPDPDPEPNPDPDEDEDEEIDEAPDSLLQRLLTPTTLALIGAALVLLAILGGLLYWQFRRRRRTRHRL